MKLKELGFNCIQLNIAWGSRPNDEPLNLEDVVDVQGTALAGMQTLPLMSGKDPIHVEKRRANLRERIALCKSLGLRTLFHFGAPYNMHARFGDSPPNCLIDERVIGFYEALLQSFSAQFPGVDDILLYTYDQDAWLCSEFADCPRCRGIPLHHRVSAFVNRLGQTWHNLNPDGRIWWEPWELSAGQVLQAISRLNPVCTALALHSNIAEVMAALPVDRWLKNSVTLARKTGLPVVVEHWLGGPTEEVEPFQHLSWPLVTWRSLKAIAALEVEGIKEYYGSVPTREDANLRMTACFFRNPTFSEHEALEQIAEPYGACAAKMILFWQATSEAMELFPWDTSWFIREIGRCNPVHTMNAAIIRGQQAHTPSWDSTRRAIFMKTDDLQPDPWLLEDVQLRCDLAAARLEEAITLGKASVGSMPALLAHDMEHQLAELADFKKRTLSYVYHIRETNLTRILRQDLAKGQPLPLAVIAELKDVLSLDMHSQNADDPCLSAIQMLESDPQAYVRHYFTDASQEFKGHFSMTSH